MDARELRIGNYIQYFGNVVQVEGIVNESNGFGLQLNGGDFASINSNSLEPIPLTEEWLVKFGFDSCKSPNKDIQVGIVENEMSFVWRGFVLKKIQHVHQLQNLYFALTGEELTLKTK